MGETAQVREHATALFRFLKEVVELRTKTLRSVDDYELVLWLADIASEGRLCSAAWDDDRSAEEIGESWLDIRKPDPRPHPSIPPSLKPWLSSIEAADSTLEYPELRVEELFDDGSTSLEGGGPTSLHGSSQAAPELLDLWEKWVDSEWQPWATRDRRLQQIQGIYDELFSVHQKLQMRSDEFELLFGFGLLSWQTPSGQTIKRHLVTVRCDLTFDPSRGHISIAPSPEGRLFNLEQEMLEVAERPGPDEVKSIEEQLGQVGGEFWRDDSLQSVLTTWVNAARSAGRFDESSRQERSAEKDPVVYWAPAIIVRKRTARPLLDFYARIIGLLEAGAEVPAGVEALVTATDERSDPDGETQTAVTTGEAQEVYFPLPANAEQFQIVQRLESARGLLVQGPPGTGKSHTIANLITHLLATGQRVLVTSQTARALRVLKEKLPEEISDLCVLLIGDDRAAMADLDRSVQGITSRFNTWNRQDNQARIATLESELDEARRREVGVRDELVAVRESEIDEYRPLGGTYAGTLREIAVRLNEERPRLGWIDLNGSVISGDHGPLTNEEARDLLRLLRSMNQADLEDFRNGLPSADSLPSASAFESAVVEEQAASRRFEATAREGDLKSVDHAARAGDEALMSADKVLDDLRQSRAGCLARPEGWCVDAANDILAGKTHTWAKLADFTRRTLEWVDTLPPGVMNTSVVGMGNRDLSIVRADAWGLHNHLLSGGTLGNALVRPQPVRSGLYLIKEVHVDGLAAKTPEVLDRLVQWLDLTSALEGLSAQWSQLTPLPQGTVEWRVSAYRDLLGVLDQVIRLSSLVQSAQAVIGAIPGVAQVSWDSDESLSSAQHTVQAALARNVVLRAQAFFDEALAGIETELRNDTRHAASTALLTALERRDVVAFRESRKRILDLLEARAGSQRVDELMAHLAAVAPTTATELRESSADAVWDQRMSEFEDAWAWLRADKWLAESVQLGALERLAQRWDTARADIRRLLGELAEARAWGYCFDRMTEYERKHLIAWMLATKKIGKGTGKYAAQYRRDARENMQKCRSAIPAWVMPIYRVAEAVNPGDDQFDVVIVDEASQSGIEALFLQFIGKKMLVVGDDKQIQPEYIGTNRQAVRELNQRHLKDFPLRTAFDVESSLFNQAELHFGSRIRLREHFRCMPEIIQFSNVLCYANDPLVPLRQFGSERLDPIQRVYVKDGYQVGQRQQVANEPEAEALVRTIVLCCRDPRYRDRTMGVICLLGDNQARLIERKLLAGLGAEEMERRRLVCGKPYSFQGDERDVMFLSMVSAPGDGHKIGALNSAKDERRFNVAASRAKDQLWLFHSVTERDLNPECVRLKLLKYCSHPKIDPIVAAGDVSVDALRQMAADSVRRQESPPRPLESWFQVDVLMALASRGYRVAPEYEVAGYRIDLVVEGAAARLAVECDGDIWHGPEQYEADMYRQRNLERCGWTFSRIRASEFYRDPERTLDNLWKTLDLHGIRPEGETDKAEPEEAGHEGTQTILTGEISELPHDSRDDNGFVGASGAMPTELDDEGIAHGDPVELGGALSDLGSDDEAPPKQGWLRHPVVGVLPPDVIPAVAEYVMADVSVDFSGDDLCECASAELAAWLKQVVEVESPVHIGEASRRVARAAGVQRVGNRIEAAFRSAASYAVSHEEIRQVGDFLWSTARADPIVRNRRLLPPAIRKVELIPDEEIEWALAHRLRERGLVRVSSAPQQVMRLFGFDRTSKEAEHRVEAALERGVAAHALVVKNDSVMLALAGASLGSSAQPHSPDSESPNHAIRNGFAKPYVVAQPTLSLRGRQFHEIGRDELAAALAQVAEVEGPIHVAEAARRLASSVGLERVGNRIQATVFEVCRRLEREGQLERHDDFLSRPGATPAVRDRSDAPLSVRNIRMVPPSEIRLAASLLGEQEDRSLDDFVVEISRLLGFRRVGKDVQAGIRSAIKGQ